MTFNSYPERLGKTYKLKGSTKLYITINKDENGIIREVFINAASSGSTMRSLCEALGKSVSIALQYEKNLLPKLIKSFENDLSESFWFNKQFSEPAKSIPDALSKVLKKEKEENDWLPIKTAPIDGTEVLVKTDSSNSLPSFECRTSYHKDAGWCVDEIRNVVLWKPILKES